MKMTEKKIFKNEFNELLKSIPDISLEEREYLNQVFANDLIDGLTEYELMHKIEHLKFDSKDQIDQWEADKIKQKLLGAFGKN